MIIRRLTLQALLVAALGWALPGYAMDIVACVDDVPAIPYTYPNHEGMAQYLLRTAGERLGMRVRFVAEPRRRCLYNIKAGHYQIMVAIGDSPLLRESYAYPMRNGQVDTQRAIVATAAIFVTRAGSRLSWDGKRLHGNTGPVLIRAGIPAYENILDSKGIQWSNPAHSLDAVARMLIAGRSDIALMRVEEFEYLKAQPAFVNQLQAIEPAVIEGFLYTVANREFAISHAQQMNALWDEMVRIRNTPEFKQRVFYFPDAESDAPGY